MSQHSPVGSSSAPHVRSTRRGSSSLSPVKRAAVLGEGTPNHPSTAPAPEPAPTPSGRMSLSALVNSPPPPPHPLSPPAAAGRSTHPSAGSAAGPSSRSAYRSPSPPRVFSHPQHPPGYSYPHAHAQGRDHTLVPGGFASVPLPSGSSAAGSRHAPRERDGRELLDSRDGRDGRDGRQGGFERTRSYNSSHSEYGDAHLAPTTHASGSHHPLVSPNRERAAFLDNSHSSTAGLSSSSSQAAVRAYRGMMPSALLTGAEEIWEDALRDYQTRREAEVRMVQALLGAPMGMTPRDYPPDASQAGSPLPITTKEALRLAREADKASRAAIKQQRDVERAEKKRQVADEREEKKRARGEARKRFREKTRETKANQRGKDGGREPTGSSAVEDELLGLAEGEEEGDEEGAGAAGANGNGHADMYGEEEDEMNDSQARPSSTRDGTRSPSGTPAPRDPLRTPSGLLRADVIAQLEAGQLTGLTEEDVKAVQDEMWLRQKAAGADGADLGDVKGMIRKDGSIRKKPGPAKGWKKLRGLPEGRGSKNAASGSGVEGASEAGEDGEEGDEVEEDIAALLDDEEGEGEQGDSDEENEQPGTGQTIGRKGLLDEVLGEAPPPPKKSNKIKEPGVGKGRWTRPPKAAAALASTGAGDVSMTMDEEEEEEMKEEPVQSVSEAQAKERLEAVEELQRNVWAGIMKDIPRMYRVLQAYDTVVKQDCARTAQACVRNAFAQRGAKESFKSQARINKDAVTKGKRVVKELLVYWRRNERDELAARKRAEKEALDRAKAEEEAREAKRQSRKLNFLLTQTELYSHFIGKKIRTKEAEGGMGEGEAKEAEEEKERMDLDRQDQAELKALDYDEDDEANLLAHAARGAQAAVRSAREKAAAFDAARANAQASGARVGAPPDPTETLDLDGDELNFQNPSLGENSVTITQPKMLHAQLKEYQLKGLTWLGNLYEQGINGILADEMGLGKTIQSISLLAYLAEHHNLWGPFLVIAPSSTLHNWQQELTRFVPRLKTLPYWGSPKDRETLRRIWSRKNMTFNEDSPFHILVTSYQLAVLDEKYFHGVMWQYMILDEAQAIKSSSSARWKSLLSFRCRNRLLLTGTPIQNSMHELWALLHFIMPSLFDSHEEFSEWFSRDIENAAGGGGGQLKPEQLRRLHMILKPFMLRRVKRHVQKELGEKIEIDVLVDLSQRQRSIYRALRQRVSISDLLAEATNVTDANGLASKNLMNLVMQFRKVCNHPDLFERADVVAPYMFGSFSYSGNLARQGDTLYCPDSAKNAIQRHLPKLIWEEGIVARASEESKAGSRSKVLGCLMNIWEEAWMSARRWDGQGEGTDEWGFLRIIGRSVGDVRRDARKARLVQMVNEAEDAAGKVQDGPFTSDLDFAASTRSCLKYDHLAPSVPCVRCPTDPILPSLRDIASTAFEQSFLSRPDARFVVESAVAPPVKPSISSGSFARHMLHFAQDPTVHTALYGLAPSQVDDPAVRSPLPSMPRQGLLATSDRSQLPLPAMLVPPIKRLIVDSAKLARLDQLLRQLKDEGHRVLLYFQMTKMMDLVEEYLIYRQYRYLRLDGASPIAERRDMVTSWQTNPDIFVFCLSTRAGGLGINLTAADTVIFYDHDWNPSNDSQAMDRAHRVGQTKQVTVYRLIARGTIEERIVKLARAKKDVQDIVVGTKSLTDVAKPSEIASLFMDDEELAESVAKRKQAEAHGYVAPAALPGRPRSRFEFGDVGLGPREEDEDDFFNTKKRVANAEDEDFGDEAEGGAQAQEGGAKKKRKKPTQGEGAAKAEVKKRKAEGEPTKKKPKKVKIALGPDGLPL